VKNPATHLIAALREPPLRLILLIDATSLPPDFPVQFALAVQQAERIEQANILATPWHLGLRADSYCTVTHSVGTTEGAAAILPTIILAKAIST
jgi:hypothetical protein